MGKCSWLALSLTIRQTNHIPSDDAVSATADEPNKSDNPADFTAMHVANTIRDKIKRRKGLKQSGGGDVNGLTNDKPSEQPARRRSNRSAVLRKRPTTVETMETPRDTFEWAKTTLDERIAAAENSPAYGDERRTLLEHERKGLWDTPARLRASNKEREANRILIQIRENERIDPNLFGDLPSEAVPTPNTRDMGGRFLVNKPRIEESKIFAIASRMPKGAHLHLHFNAEIPPEKLMRHAREPAMEDNMFIRSTRPLLQRSDFAPAEIVFEVLPKETKTGNIFSADYNPNWKEPDTASWMRWIDFRRQFPKDIPVESTAGGSEDLVDPAEYWAREKMIVTIEQAYSDRQTLNGSWACFNQGTRAFKGMVNYESVYRWYIGAAMDSMIRDKVMYAELRPMLLDKSIPSNDGKRRLNHKDQMAIVCEEVKKKKKELEAKNQLHLFPFGLKIIYCTPRSIPREKMKGELKDCLDLKLAFPDLICGFDLVGAEDRPYHIGFYADLLVAFADTCKELNVNIPFMFHAGESLLDTGGSHNPDNSNLYDSLLLNAKRIGHGYSILKHPLLVEKYREKGICLELCPISNELLHLCGNIRQHIFPELLAAGLQCTLNGDNPSLYRGPGRECASLSHEFCQVLMGDTRMSIHGWKQLAEWSIEHSCLSDEQKKQGKIYFHRAWEEFCQWVVDEYGDFAGGLKDLVNGTTTG